MTNPENSDSDADPTDPDTVHVDLSNGESSPDPEGQTPGDEVGDAAGTASGSPDAGDSPNPDPEPAPEGRDPSAGRGETSEDRLRQQAQNVVQEHIRQAPGPTEADQVTHALRELRQKRQQAQENLQELHQQRQQLAAQRDQFGATVDHLEEIAEDEDDDRLILRDWAAGITTEVTDDELDEVIERISERMEQQSEAQSDVEAEAKETRRDVQVLQYACEQLQSTKETLSGTGVGGGTQQPRQGQPRGQSQQPRGGHQQPQGRDRQPRGGGGPGGPV